MASVSAQLQFDNYQQEHKTLYALANQLYNEAQQHANTDLLNQALSHALKARAIRPDYLLGLNLLARIELARQNYAAAELWVEQGLAIKPNSVNLLYSAGQIALRQNYLKEAEQYFEQVLKISRVATKALNMLAHVKLLQGDYPEAFRHYRELAQTQAKDIRVRSKLFEAADQLIADFYAEELEQDLLRYLDFPQMDYSLLRNLSTSLLRHKLRLSETGCPLELEALAGDPLLLKSLTKFYFTDPIFERLFITLRQSLLFSCSQSLAIPQHLLPLIVALAQQCWLNEGVYYESEQEHALVEQLAELCKKMLQLDSISSHDIYPALLLVLMYRPLVQTQLLDGLTKQALEWPDFMAEFICQQINELTQLEEHKQGLTSINAPLRNQVSVKVQQQYDQYPYPRWLDIGYNEPADYAMALRQTFPNAKRLLPKPKQTLQALVAGCGTGRHAIRLRKYFPSLQVTALDLSQSALAYAIDKAKHYNVTDIKFVQGDILEVERLEQAFDLIECSGVLHHMQHPEQGLQALVQQLKPGGVIKIALYSRTARREIIQLREMLGSHLPSDLTSMRLVREAMMQKSLPGDWQSILASPDFYSASACKDLIFHEQEHQFDVLELPEFLANAGLQWLGMLPPPGSQALLSLKLNASLSQQHSSDLSIEQWHELEQNNPNLFASMYQFYAIKPR